MKNKNLIYYIISQSISKIGSAILDFSIIWTIVLTTNGNTPFIISILITYFPKVIVSFFINRVFEMKNKHKIYLIVGDLFIALCSFILCFVDNKNLLMIYGVIFFRSIGNGVVEPYSNSIIVHLFNKDEYKKVNSLNSLMKSVISIIIPTLSALIISNVSLNFVALIDVFTAIIASILVSKLYFSSLNEEKSLKEVYKGNEFSKTLLKYNTIFYFVMAPAGYMTALLVKEFFGQEILYLNLNETFWTLGMILGSIAIAHFSINLEKIYGYSILIFGITILILSLATNIVLYLMIILLSGIVFPFYSNSSNILVQNNLSNTQVEAYYIRENLFINISTPLGIVIYGYFSEKISINNIFMIAAIFIMIVGLCSNYSIKKIM